MSGGLTPLYGMWRQYNSRLVERIRSLSDEQLKLQPRADYLPIWAVAAHTAGGRVYWLCGVLKEKGAETTPFADASGFGWEDDLSRPRSSSEVVTALESSWNIVERCLEEWTPSMLADEFTREMGGKTQVHTRQSVIMRLITHEAYHNGEISLVLGMNGLPAIDVWRSSPT